MNEDIIKTRFGEFYNGEIVKYSVYPFGEFYATITSKGVRAIGKKAYEAFTKTGVSMEAEWDDIDDIKKLSIATINTKTASLIYIKKARGY